MFFGLCLDKIFRPACTTGKTHERGPDDWVACGLGGLGRGQLWTTRRFRVYNLGNRLPFGDYDRRLRFWLRGLCCGMAILLACARYLTPVLPHHFLSFVSSPQILSSHTSNTMGRWTQHEEVGFARIHSASRLTFDRTRRVYQKV
jgi:hypothetical protein